MQLSSLKRKGVFEDEEPSKLSLTDPYPLYQLVCTNFREETLLNFLLYPRGNCSIYGSKIAESLVHLASTRIFAEPEQSILELPVNSLDAYSEKGSVGKFGLGFFSILYWLIGHPLRVVIVKSVKNRRQVYARIQQVNNVLCVQLEWNPRQASVENGTRVELDCTHDPLPKDTLIRFSQQLTKLQYVRGGDLLVRQYGFPRTIGGFTNVNPKPMPFQSYNGHPDNPNKIYLQLSPEGLSVQDSARGMSLRTLLTKLLIPTVSVKSFQLEEAGGVESLRGRLEVPEQPENRLLFIVRSVAVVSLPFLLPVSKDYFHVILDLPSSTSIPVSRDDILLTPALQSVLSTQFQELVQQSVAFKNIHLLEKALETYIEYTSHESNKVFFQQVLTSLASGGFVRVHYQNFTMLNTLTQGANPFVQSMYQDTEQLVEFLQQHFLGGRQDVFFNKTVIPANIQSGVYHPDNLSVTNARLPFFVFVNTDSFPTLPIIYSQDKLYLQGTEYATEVHADIVLHLQRSFQRGTGGTPFPPIVQALAMEIVYKWSTFWDENKYVLTNIKYTKCTGQIKVVKSKQKAIYYLLFDMFWLLRVSPLPMVVRYLYEMFDVFQGFASAPVQLSYGEEQKTQFTLQDSGFSSKYELLFLVPPNQEVFLMLLSQLAAQGYVVNWGLALQRLHKRSKLHWNMVNSWSFFHPVYFLFYLEQSSEEAQTNVALLSLFVRYMVQQRVEVDVLLRVICVLDCVFMSESEDVSLHDLFGTQFDKLYAFIQTQETSSDLVYNWVCNKHEVEAAQVRNRFLTSARLKGLVVPIDLPRLALPYAVFSQSKLVHYVVTHDVHPSYLFQDVEIWEPQTELHLPITEIAINEGSAKSFVNAVLTETVQNSLDAIRSSLGTTVRPEIRCEVGEDRQFYIYKITDFVGLPQESVLPLMLPFLSSKKPSGQVTTGEMGSGFFNLYRESELVFIDSTLHGRRILIVDEPIEHSGRVVDLMRRVQVSEVPDITLRQTDIYVCMDKTNTLRISSFLSFIQNVLALIPDVPVYLNGQSIRVPTVPLLETELFLGFHIVKPDMQSYVFTKGVPFSPLYEFIKTSGLFTFYDQEFLASEFRTGIVVHLKQNVFTPVQTRARISLLPTALKSLKQFLLDVLYLSLLTKISEHSVVNVNYYLPNFTSSAPLVQMLPARSKDVRLEGYGGITTLSPFLMSSKYPGTHVSFSDMVHNVYIMFGDQLIDLRVVQERYGESCPPLLLNVVKQWLKTKNRLKSSLTTQPQTAHEVNVVIQERLKHILKKFVTLFWNLGKQLQIKNFENRNAPEVTFESNDDSVYMAYYRDKTHSITVNYSYVTKEISQEDLLQFLSVFNIRDLTLFMTLLQSLEHNTLWQSFFASNVNNNLIHELEHARRNTGNHSSRTFSILTSKEMVDSILAAGIHDSITVKLAPMFGIETYTFDQGALTVYKLMLSNHFFELLHKSMWR